MSNHTQSDLDRITSQKGYSVASTGIGAHGPIRGVPVAAKPRLRQSSKPVINKLETRFYEHESKNVTLIPQAIRLELARGLWYKPDFFAPYVPMFFEVKGPHAFRGGYENLKMAARVHRWARFFLVWEDKNKAWQRQEILP